MKITIELDGAPLQGATGQGEAAVPAQQVLGSAELQNMRGLVLDDPVRAMHILPGVAATDDLYAEFSVRGSDFGRIGLAVDGVPSRFLSHSGSRLLIARLRLTLGLGFHRLFAGRQQHAHVAPLLLGLLLDRRQVLDVVI